MTKKKTKEHSIYELKLMELVEAGKKAFDLLVKEVERPIDEELQDGEEVDEKIQIDSEKNSVYTGGYAEQFAKKKK